MSKIDFLMTLQDVIQQRLREPSESSYTARMAAGGDLKVAQKVGEEGVELALAAVAQDSSRVTSEAADLMYHLLLLLAIKGLTLENVVAELERRHLG
jgi:phosphoribosyl-ATP pyrophosphohydrolase